MDNISTNSRVYTASDIRTILGISKATTYDLLNKAYKERKPFKVIKIGKSVRVPKDSFDAWFYSSDEVAV